MKDIKYQDISIGDTVLFIPHNLPYTYSEPARWGRFHLGVIKSINNFTCDINWPNIGYTRTHKTTNLLKVSPDLRRKSNEDLRQRLLLTLKIEGYNISNSPEFRFEELT